jgi:hypothetical protein
LVAAHPQVICEKPEKFLKPAPRNAREGDHGSSDEAGPGAPHRSRLVWRDHPEGDETVNTEVDERASADELLLEAEPWEPWEAKLVGWSIAIGFVSLIILGVLINLFIL